MDESKHCDTLTDSKEVTDYFNELVQPRDCIKKLEKPLVMSPIDFLTGSSEAMGALVVASLTGADST